MKKLIRRGMMFLLSFCMVVNMSLLSSFAIDHSSSVDFSAYDAATVQMLRDLNILTDEEIVAILEYDKTHPVNPETLARTIVYPENPTEGTVIEGGSFSIYYDDVKKLAEGGIVAIAAYIAAKVSLPAAACSLLAGFIMNTYMSNNKFTRIDYTLKYRYGMTNDGYMGWTPFFETEVIY